MLIAETIFAGGKWDTFRMPTHPGTAIMPAALVAGEVAGSSGSSLTAVAAAYEVMELNGRRLHPNGDVARLSRRSGFRDFWRGDRGGQARRTRRRADTRRHRMQCVNLASGNLEGIRSGGRLLREGGAVRNALLAVALAKQGTPGGETTAEGEAGFYHSYAGEQSRRAALQLHRRQPAPRSARSPPASARTGCSSRRCTASIRPSATTSPMST